MKRRRPLFQDQLASLTLIAVAPAWLTAAWLLWRSEASPALRWALFALIGVCIAGGVIALRQRLTHPLQALANMLEALREGDYSLRARNIDPEDALGEVMIEVNALSRMLQDQRLKALEADVLLSKVIAEVDIAVFAFDAERRLRLLNRAGEALFGARAADLIGRNADELGIAAMLDGAPASIVNQAFPGGAGRWEVRRRRFRERGRPHELLVISDLSRALRDEERQAWRRLVRVIGHELNNSLTPIKSMAGTLRKIFDREPLPDDWRDDARTGLAIIHDRAEALERFMGAYARLARLPPPARKTADFASIVRRVASLHGDRVQIENGPATTVAIDADQIEQALINLVKNAVEAAGEEGTVRIRWQAVEGELVAEVEDDGPGLALTDNLWVPFFTTKPGGAGIGLVLSREIIENHGGRITLDNRTGTRGCLALIRLPLS